MAEVKKSPPLAPVQPAQPSRGPARKRKPPTHKEGRGESEQRRRRGDPDADHLLDEYV